MIFKKAFAKLTNVESWEEAEESFPAFAREEQLKRFVGSNLKKGIPTSFHAKIRVDDTH